MSAPGVCSSPAMNFLPARWIDGRPALPIGSHALAEGMREQVEAAEGSLIASFRPEHLRVFDANSGENLTLSCHVSESQGS